MPIRVKIDPRDDCISDGVCISMCPDVFDWHEDGKSMIKKEFQIDDNPGLGEVSDDLEDCIADAASACPVQIIHYEKV